jgi:hypothetical protein
MMRVRVMVRMLVRMLVTMGNGEMYRERTSGCDSGAY